MGRIFEVRKATMFARWNRMAKQFARIAKDITMAVKAGGPDPAGNPSLRRAVQNARAVNMPKDKIESAIKRASGRDAANYQQVLYEAYAPHGIAMLIETATDNPVRTVATRAQSGHQERRQSRHQRQRQFPVPEDGRVPPGSGRHRSR